MNIPPDVSAGAQAAQHKAAHDSSPQVRLVAGPGSGKSRAIEERVCWLLNNGVRPDAIFVVSFTRAAARDLKGRIVKACDGNGHTSAKKVSVTTLHSLALRTLREGRLLEAYPAPPIILDDWELERIFDEEFGNLHNIGKARREEIREFYEAFWSTDQYDPPNYVVPDPPISGEERERFEVFNRERTQIYSCVLAGEIVRKCVEHIESGVLEPAHLIGIQHLIVDEYQDLNPMDLRFVNRLAEQGVIVFVAGDDDQSIYSFRYASPAGIQSFHREYPAAGLHSLDACFRCTPAILATAGRLSRSTKVL